MSIRPGDLCSVPISRACGVLSAGAHEPFKYRRDEGGFTEWLANRLPDIPKSSAYRAIQIFEGLKEDMFAHGANIPAKVLEQIAKAEPDIQALIAERVEAGEIFTAAKVKEIHDRPRGGFVVAQDKAGA